MSMRSFGVGFLSATSLLIMGMSALNAPPILPFTEISDEKITSLKERMLKSDAITLEDCRVVMQLEHEWRKKIAHREIFYHLAKNDEGNTVVETRTLGKLWDKVDRDIEDRVEKALQNIVQDIEEKKALDKNKKSADA